MTTRRFPKRPSLETMVERVDQQRPGDVPGDTVPTGFPSIDRILGGGLRRRDLVVLGGDIGSGKSALALGLALRTAQQVTGVALFSGEMDEERLMERALAIEGRATVDELRSAKLNDQTRAGIGGAAVRLRDLPLTILPLAAPDFETAAERLDPLRQLGLVVDDHQPELPQWVAALRRRLEVRGRERQDREGEVAQPHGGSPDAGARLIIELGAAQLVHGRASFDREGALHQALFVHLSGEEGHAGPLLRRAQRQSEGERGLARPDVAAQHHEVATSQAPTQDPVDRGEPGRDGVARDVTGALLIHALDHGLERRTLGKAAGGHTSIDVDGLTGLQRSRRLPPRDRAPRAPARPAGTALGPRQSAWRARGGGARR